jgi:hypothetical protein
MAPLFESSPAGLRDELIAWERDRIWHLVVQNVEPQTLAYAMNDSPLGVTGCAPQWPGTYPDT